MLSLHEIYFSSINGSDPWSTQPSTLCFTVLKEEILFYNEKGKIKLCIIKDIDLGTIITQKYNTLQRSSISTFWTPCIYTSFVFLTFAKLVF